LLQNLSTLDLCQGAQYSLLASWFHSKVMISLVLCVQMEQKVLPQSVVLLLR